MPEMIATSEIEYPPGKMWKPGDRFEVEDAHVALLKINGRAKLPEEDSSEELAPRKRGRPPKAR